MVISGEAVTPRFRALNIQPGALTLMNNRARTSL
jgi:hypothetical protein